jgi:hypothetical protein
MAPPRVVINPAHGASNLPLNSYSTCALINAVVASAHCGLFPPRRPGASDALLQQMRH